MANHSSRLINFLTGALVGFVFGLTISILPVLVVEHKRLIMFFLHQPLPQLVGEAAVVACSTLAWALALGKIDKLDLPASKDLKWIKAHSFSLVATAFLFLYVACAYLCAKLHVAILPESLIAKENWQWLGAAITIVSAGFAPAALCFPSNPTAQATSDQKRTFHLRHPIYLAGLIYLIGSSVSFTTWFPLLAIPGAFVLIVWHVRQIENATVRDVSASW
jgi:hypothetical protein